MKVITGVIALLSVSSAAFAVVPATTTQPAASSAAAKPLKVVMVCPVTGEKVASIKDAAGFSDYKGTRYYFCCGGCKPAFDKNPSKYVK
ncbi:MAG: YHS domain-containing protein [Armatimonadota bacterium]|nr:YHS domain-containing protein [Armatimonadota bacterium]